MTTTATVRYAHLTMKPRWTNTQRQAVAHSRLQNGREVTPQSLSTADVERCELRADKPRARSCQMKPRDCLAFASSLLCANQNN